MQQVYWSREIARGAQDWMNNCQFSHSPQGKYTYKGDSVGENVAYRGYTGTNSVSPFKFFVEEWFNEIKDYNGNVRKFTSTKGPAIGHFTQVIWSESSIIGCGFCRKKNGRMTEEFWFASIQPQETILGNQSMNQTKNPDAPVVRVSGVITPTLKGFAVLIKTICATRNLSSGLIK